MGQWIDTQRAAGAAKAAALASAAVEIFCGRCLSATTRARAVRALRARTWVAWTCACGQLNEAPCRDAAEAHAASVCSSCRAAWVAEGDRYQCRCIVSVPGGSTQCEDWLAKVTMVGPPPHRPAPAHIDGPALLLPLSPPPPCAKTQLFLPRVLVAQVVLGGPWLRWVPAGEQACDGPETLLSWRDLSRGLSDGTYLLVSRGAAAAPGRSRQPPSRFGR